VQVIRMGVVGHHNRPVVVQQGHPVRRDSLNAPARQRVLQSDGTVKTPVAAEGINDAAASRQVTKSRSEARQLFIRRMARSSHNNASKMQTCNITNYIMHRSRGNATEGSQAMQTSGVKGRAGSSMTVPC